MKHFMVTINRVSASGYETKHHCLVLASTAEKASKCGLIASFCCEVGVGAVVNSFYAASDCYKEIDLLVTEVKEVDTEDAKVLALHIGLSVVWDD